MGHWAFGEVRVVKWHSRKVRVSCHVGSKDVGDVAQYDGVSKVLRV